MGAYIVDRRVTSVLGKKKTESTVDETRADRVMGRDEDAATGRDDAVSEKTQPIAAADKGSAASGGGSTSATAADAPKPNLGGRARSSYGEDESENEPTRVQPIPTKGSGAGTSATTKAAGAGAVGAAAGAGAATAAKGRDADTTRGATAKDADATRDLEAERAAERERRRAEREKALGTRHKAVEEPEPAPVVRPKRTTDKFFGSLGLFLLRLVTAAIIGLHGLWKVMNLDKVEQMLNNTIIPEPHIMSYVLACSEIAIALGLLFGMLTRLAGLGLALVAIGALVFVKWVKNPFSGYQLSGELELLLGAVGILFLLLGAGGWSVDAAFRRRRAANKKA